MAYDRDDIYKTAEAAIKEHGLFFIEDIVAYVTCGRTAFYEFFPLDSDEMNTIKELLNLNKVKTKVEIREKLKKGDRAAELLALYRLICTPEERKSLNQSYIDHTTDGEKIQTITGFNVN